MEAIYQFVHLESSDSLKDFTQQKLEKLENKFDQIISAEVHFRKQEGNEPPNAFICNISLSVPGPNVFAESTKDSFEAAIADCVKELDRQLTKKKEQIRTY
ncbi:MAG TPA: ribosome-associated translation inhibitor RaiA [Salinimicrobium sp.]|nr:ribosome-associated translation inhibitor RaiA [Salinimicrobium sp.]